MIGNHFLYIAGKITFTADVYSLIIFRDIPIKEIYPKFFNL